MKVMFIVNDLGVNEPFGPMMLSAILRENGHLTTLGVLKKEDVTKKIASWKPDMLAYSMMSVDMVDMKRFNDSLRKSIKIFTILGGPHATLDRNCVNDSGIDAICVGEGDEAIVDVVAALEKGKSLEAISNIMTSSESTLELRHLIEDFDSLPFMDRDLVYAYPEMARFGIKGIWTSRGCAFQCPYCFNNRYNKLYKGKGNIVRRRSVDSVIKETAELVANYRVDFIRIQDDVFALRVDGWLREFCERWASEIGIPFYCLLRVEYVTDEMALCLKKAGCFSICMSTESADDNVRNGMLRRRATKKELTKVFAIFKKYKINVYTNAMLGLPFTSIDQDIASLDLYVKVRPEMPNFSIFMPYPGTDLGDYCKQASIHDPDRESINYGMRNMSPLTCFSKREKEVQYNICQLAIVAVKFPILRNLIVKHLIYWKPNKIFFVVHYLFAVSSFGRKIFYFRHTPVEYVELIIKTVKHYLYDFFKKESERSPSPRLRTPNETEGMPRRGQRKAELKKCMEVMSKGSLHVLPEPSVSMKVRHLPLDKLV